MKHNSKYALFEPLCFPAASWPPASPGGPDAIAVLLAAAGVARPRHASPGVRTPYYKITIYAYL